MQLQKWEDQIKHARARDSDAQQDTLASDAVGEVSPEQAAFMALKKWAGTGRKCRQALKRANPTAVEELELHYLQFMRQVGMTACPQRTWPPHYPTCASNSMHVLTCLACTQDMLLVQVCLVATLANFCCPFHTVEVVIQGAVCRVNLMVS